MIALYGRHYFARYRAIANLIAPSSTVLDLCCGPGILYRRYLRHKSILYTGFDLNQRFIRNLIQAGVPAQTRDLRSEESLPASDYVIMQASLYHFLPDPERILQRMMVAARKALIISEPILNLGDSKSALVHQLSGRLTNAGNGSESHRFNEQSLDELFSVLGWRPKSAFSISGGREKVFVFAKDH